MTSPVTHPDFRTIAEVLPAILARWRHDPPRWYRSCANCGTNDWISPEAIGAAMRGR